MIKNRNQSWNIGDKVNIGFMKGLIIINVELTPGDYKPDAYILQNSNNANLYRFVPHNGIERIL